MITIAVATVVVLAVYYATIRVGVLSPATQRHAITGGASIVIAARNEEHNLRGLLADLDDLDRGRIDVIVVDDDSTDATATLAADSGATVLPATDRPATFNPKVWALDVGARRATGDTLLFLDADVRLAPGAAETLINDAQQHGGLFTVSPYHLTQRLIESFSALCNVIMVLGAGPGLGQRAQGAVGSTIAVPTAQYWQIGGHAADPSTIVDDLALAARAKQHHVPITVLRGGPALTTRMYDGGIRSIWAGWTKNFAAGAEHSGIAVSLLVAAWMTVLILPVALAVQQRWVTAGLLWALNSVFTLLTTRLVGRFSLALTSVGAPLLALFVTAVTVASIFRRLFGRTAHWKGRELTPSGLEDRP